MSFRKRHVQKPIPGTRTSPQTGQVITSSGNPSLDVLLGGGLPIGSICLIEEDKHVTHAKVLAKYFLAEGIISGQTVFLGSLDDDPQTLLSKLPKPINEGEVENGTDETKLDKSGEGEGSIDKMRNGLRIAWRYNDLPIVNSEPATTKIGHNFNLMEHMDTVLLERAETVTWSGIRGQHNDSIKRISVHEDEETEEEDEIHYAANRRNIIIDDSANDNKNSIENNNSNDMVVEQETLPPSHEQQQQQQTQLVEEAQQEKENQPVEQSEKSEKENEERETEPMQSTNDGIDEALQVADANNKNNSLFDETSSTDVMEIEMQNKSELESTLSCSSTEMAKGEPPKKPGIFENPKYLSLYNQLQPLLHDDKFFHSTMVQKGLCRICITSLGSPLWYREERFGEDLLKFLTVLRACVRSIVSVCFITIPMHLIAKFDETLVAKIRNLVDYSIELESFAGSERETHPAFEQYNGLLHLRKISAVNALSAHMPETTDLAFKLRRKKFIIEKLHLPPDIQENSTDASTPCSTKVNYSNTNNNNNNSNSVNSTASPAKGVNLASLDF